MGREKNEQKNYDLVIARAVASLVDLIKWSKPFLRSGGRSARCGGDREKVELATLKGGDLTAEVNEARIKTGAASIRTIPIVFEGSIEIGLEEKKLIVVHR
jgi:16S rRNA G527 N7-methylase RsmG